MEALITVNLKGIENKDTKKLVLQSIWKILDQSNQGAIENFFEPPEIRDISGLNLQFLRGRSLIGEDDLFFFGTSFPDGETTEKKNEFIQKIHGFPKTLPPVMQYDGEVGDDTLAVSGAITITGQNILINVPYSATKNGSAIGCINERKLPRYDIEGLGFKFFELAKPFPDSPRNRAYIACVIDYRNDRVAAFTFDCSRFVDENDEKAMAATLFRHLSSDLCCDCTFSEWAENTFGYVPEHPDEGGNAAEYNFIREVYSRKCMNDRNIVELFGSMERFREFAGLPVNGSPEESSSCAPTM